MNLIVSAWRGELILGNVFLILLQTFPRLDDLRGQIRRPPLSRQPSGQSCLREIRSAGSEALLQGRGTDVPQTLKSVHEGRHQDIGRSVRNSGVT